VKLIDFGIAKTTVGAEPDLPAGLTVTAPDMTSAGVVLGTAAYMSPEQVRGRAPDRRVDIWAFGCVLYEMLTGRRAFRGETCTETLAAIVSVDPDWSALPAGLPSAVRSLVRRCLQKDPKDRLRDAGDARIELRAVAAGREETGERTVGTRQSPRGAILWFAGGAVAAAATLLAYSALARRTTVPIEPAPARVVVTLPPGVTVALGRGSSVVLSPDGGRLAYVGRSSDGSVRLYLRALDSYEAEPIPGTENAANPFFSPDGRWLAFHAGGSLKKVSLDGGAPVALTDARLLRGEAWGPADTILVTPANNTGIMRLPAGGGRLEPFTSLASGEMSHRWPRLLPEGTVLFTIWNDTGWEPSRIVAQRPGSSAHETVVERGGGYPRYLHDASTGRGYLIYARSEGLLAAPFDPSTLRLMAQPVPVLDGVITNLSGGAHFDVAAGTLAYIPGAVGEAERDIVWVTLDGKATLARRVVTGRYVSMSPDGTRVQRIDSAGRRNLWIDDLVRGTSTRLVETPDNFVGTWSADGEWVAFSRGAPVANIYRRRTNRLGSDEQLTWSTQSTAASGFSPDGRWLAYRQTDPDTAADIWVLELPGGAGVPARPITRPFVKTPAAEMGAVFSPDGQWIAYQSNESGRFEIYVRSFPDGERVTPVSTDGGVEPVWSHSGRQLFYRGTNGMLMVVDLGPGADLRPGQPRALFDARAYENSFAVAPKDDRLLMIRAVDTESAARVVHVVVNFVSELRRRAW
jgi:serine/threonine-protein kinase